MAPPRLPINLRDVARAAGVSTAAVSFALNGRPGVSEKSRAHILKVARRLGYQPDAELRKLMACVAARRTRRIEAALGVLTGFAMPRPWEYFLAARAFWDGARERAADLGYQLEEFWYYEPGMTPKRLRGILQARGIEGLLLLFAHTRDAHMRLDFDFTGFAAAMSGICCVEPKLSFVLPDHFQNVLLAMERTVALGYRRPLLVLTGNAARRTLHFMEGAYLYFCSVHPEVTALPIHRQEGYDEALFTEALERKRPDVVISTFGNWRNCPAVERRRIGWVSLDWMRETDQGVAGIDRRLEDQASVVVDVVVAQIHRREYGVPAVRREILVPGHWVDGRSLPPKGGAPRGSRRERRH